MTEKNIFSGPKMLSDVINFRIHCAAAEHRNVFLLISCDLEQ